MTTRTGVTTGGLASDTSDIPAPSPHPSPVPITC